MGVETVHEIRAAIARGEWRKPTSGVAAGFTQANVVILPKRYAFDFLLFCDRNPQPCPVIDVAEAGGRSGLSVTASDFRRARFAIKSRWDSAVERTAASAA